MKQFQRGWLGIRTFQVALHVPHPSGRKENFMKYQPVFSLLFHPDAIQSKGKVPEEVTGRFVPCLKSTV